jgi:molecular chaperone GrpE (heat shock protein)
VLDGAPGERLEPARHRVVARDRDGAGQPGQVTQVSQLGVVCLGQRVRRARVVAREE